MSDLHPVDVSHLGRPDSAPRRGTGRRAAPRLSGRSSSGRGPQGRLHLPRRSRAAPRDGPVTLDFIAVSSYAKGTTSSGEVRTAERPRLRARGQERGHRRRHRRHRPDADLPAGHPPRARSTQPADRVPAQQALAAQGRRQGRVRRASPSRTGSSSATVSTTPSSIATCRTSPSSAASGPTGLDAPAGPPRRGHRPAP